MGDPALPMRGCRCAVPGIRRKPGAFASPASAFAALRHGRRLPCGRAGEARMIRVGVDVGGTFTDIVLERSGDGAEQQVVVTKVSSTPHDQSEGVVEGILKVCGARRRRAGRHRRGLPRHHRRHQHGDRARRRRRSA